MTTAAEPVSDGTMPCPVPHPDGVDAPCAKTIPEGWTADEGHGGGHFWISAESRRFMDTAHYDLRDTLSFRPMQTHEIEDCNPYCPRWDDTQRRPVRSTP